jgi:hypothetical protein
MILQHSLAAPHCASIPQLPISIKPGCQNLLPNPTSIQLSRSLSDHTGEIWYGLRQMGGIPDDICCVLSCYVPEPAGLWSSFPLTPPSSYVALDSALIATPR